MDGLTFIQTASCSTAIRSKTGPDSNAFSSDSETLFDFKFYENRMYQKAILDNIEWVGEDHTYCKKLLSVR